jgi:molybdate transport system substrate-binding protein
LRSRLAGVLLAVSAVLGACSGIRAGSPASDATAKLTVYAAASLKGALDVLAPAYGASHPGAVVTLSTDSSASLEAQIEQGAPADVFLSADVTNPQKLVDAGLATGVALPFAGNELVVIAPAANPAAITSPADLGRPGVKIVAGGDAVPVTKYALQLVANLANQPGYPARFAAAYAANVVSREDNVKAIVAKIELGEGDAGIVYVTDARASKKVTAIDVPAAANVRATYAGGVIKASSQQARAAAFLAWVAGPEGQAILGTFGFLPPS